MGTSFYATGANQTCNFFLYFFSLRQEEYVSLLMIHTLFRRRYESIVQVADSQVHHANRSPFCLDYPRQKNTSAKLMTMQVSTSVIHETTSIGI